jgi:ABC-type Fe3+ transport system substrate-binding protein
VHESIEELYSNAQKEGGLSLYVAGPLSFSEPWARLFETEYPGIAVEIRNGPSVDLVDSIDQQRASGRLQADIAILQTLQDFVRWKADGALTVINSDEFGAIAPEFKDDEGFYVGVQVLSVLYAYNTDLLGTDRPPAKATDFLDPRWRGQIIIGYPSADEVVLYLMSTIVDKYGWDFMPSLMANEPRFVFGHVGVTKMIGEGQYAVTFDAINKLASDERVAGQPVELAIADEDPMPVWPQSAGILAGSPNPNAAALYIDWYLRPAQQARVNALGSWSPRHDIAIPADLKPLSECTLAEGLLEFMTDRDTVADLKQRFEKFTGPPTGGYHV